MINFLTIKILLHKNGYTEVFFLIIILKKKKKKKKKKTTNNNKTNRTTQKNVKIVMKFIQSQLLTNKYSKQNSKDKF